MKPIRKAVFRRIMLVICVLFVAAALGASGVNARYAASTQVPPLPLHNWKIAYVDSAYVSLNETNSVQNSTLWIANADGTDKQPLFHEEDGYLQCKWSPDGASIAVLDFKNDEHYTNLLLVLNSEGQILQNLTSYKGRNPIIGDFSWAPDGKSILYTDSFRGLFQFNLSDVNVTQILSPSGYVLDHCPAFSPDMQKIAFVHHEWGTEFYISLMDYNVSKFPCRGDDVYNNYLNPDIKIVANGSSYHNADLMLQWTPDSKTLVFANSNKSIFIVNAVNGSAVELTGNALGNSSWVTDAALSPDGTQIAFTTGTDICLLNTDGTTPRKILYYPYYGSSPTWSPDGRYLAFTAYTYTSDYPTHIINADGTCLVSPPIGFFGWNPVPWSLNNTAPTFTAMPQIDLTNQQKTQQVNLTAYASDETPSSLLNYTLVNPQAIDSRLNVTISSNQTLDVSTTANFVGSFNVTVRASDNVLSTDCTVQVTVDTPEPTPSPSTSASATVTPTPTPQIPELSNIPAGYIFVALATCMAAVVVCKKLNNKTR
jgi:Tol biopolymer transport system component